MSINTILGIRVYEKGMNYETYEYSRIRVTELYLGEINKYRMIKGSQKRLDKEEYRVDPNRMAEFFEQLYEFVRTAEYTDTLIDNCEHHITFYYGGHHKEVFDEIPFKEPDSLLDLINRFVENVATECENPDNT